MGDKPEAELKADLQLLLECLKCQQDNPSAAKQALLTIATICSSNSNTKYFFDECGGLEYILNIITTTADMYVPVKESALYCLGCCVERNASLQKKVSTSGIFSTLYGLLTSTASGIRIRQTVAFLILCIVANNSYGQVLAMRSGCIQVLIHIFRSCLGSDQKVDLIQEPIDPLKLQLWTSVASTLSMCVNNPQNDDNQRVCATLLPFMLKLLHTCQDGRILRPLGSFIGLLVASNVYNQDRVRNCGGLEVIVSTIQRLHNQSRRDSEVMELAVHIVNTLDSCIADNVNSVEVLGSHEAVRTLLSLLSEPDLDESSQLQITLTLGHLTDQSEMNQQQFLEADGLPLMLHLMGEVEDEDMCKAVKFVLQSCVHSRNPETSARTGPKSKMSTQINKIGQQIQVMYGEEANNRMSNVDGMILEKISQLSDKLETMERSSLGVDRQSTFSSYENILRDTDKNILQTAPSCPNFLMPGVLNNQHNSFELTSSQKSINSEIIQQKQKMKGQSNNLNLQKRWTVPEKRVILTDLIDSYLSSSDEESKVPSSYSKEKSKNSKDTRKELRKFNSAVSKKKQTVDAEMIELQNKKCHLLEKITKEQARCIALEKETALLQDKLAKQKQTEQTTEDINRDSSSSEQDSVVPESVHQNLSDIPKEKSRNQKEKEVPKKNIRNTVTDAKVKGLQNDKENLIGKLTKEQARYEMLEKEAVSLREQMAKQKQKEQEAEALREELEKQENEATTFTSSQSSTESKEENHDFYQATLQSPDKNASEIILKTSKEKSQSGKKKEDFLKPAPPNRPVRSRGVLGSASRQSKVKINGSTCTSRNSPKFWGNSNSSKSSMSSVSGKFTADYYHDDKKSVINVPNPDITRNAGVHVDSYHDSRPARSSSSNMYRYSTSNGRCSVNLKQNFELKSRSRSSNQLSVKRTASFQSFDKMPEVDLNASFSSDVTCMSAFDSDLMRQASRPSQHWPENTSYIHSISMGSCRSSLSVKRRPSTVLSSTPLQRRQIDQSRYTDTRACQKSIYYDREVWSVKPVRSGLKHLTSNLQDNNSDFGNQSFWQKADDDAWYPYYIPSETASRPTKGRNSLDKNGRCPGCNSSNTCGVPCLNSRTFNIALETNPHTCDAHRHIRKLERLFIKQKNAEQWSLQKSRPLEALNYKENVCAQMNSTRGDSSKSIYHFPSEDEHTKEDVSPPIRDSDSLRSLTYLQENISQKSRKLRIPYTQEETDNLRHGVKTLGKHWNQILCTYQFHVSRSAVDLMEKYKRIKINTKTESVCEESDLSYPAGPFSLCEERRLRRGVKQFGYNWKLILETHRFTKGRTREELRSKWRCLHKRSLKIN